MEAQSRSQVHYPAAVDEPAAEVVVVVAEAVASAAREASVTEMTVSLGEHCKCSATLV